MATKSAFLEHLKSNPEIFIKYSCNLEKIKDPGVTLRTGRILVQTRLDTQPGS